MSSEGPLRKKRSGLAGPVAGGGAVTREPFLLIVSSPSGAGKTTLTSALRKTIPGLEFSVSHTTRKPRKGEQDGREYHFVDRARFAEMVEAGEFLEWAEVHGNLYGTSCAEADRHAEGIIFDIDQQGARQIKAQRPDAIGVFILPPNMAVLLERLNGRASDDAETVARRYDAAWGEIGHYGLFDYVLVNDDLKVATDALASIVRAEKCRTQRTGKLAELLLDECRPKL